jgi:hypothetical protein
VWYSSTQLRIFYIAKVVAYPKGAALSNPRRAVMPNSK